MAAAYPEPFPFIEVKATLITKLSCKRRHHRNNDTNSKEGDKNRKKQCDKSVTFQSSEPPDNFTLIQNTLFRTCPVKCCIIKNCPRQFWEPFHPIMIIHYAQKVFPVVFYSIILNFDF